MYRQDFKLDVDVFLPGRDRAPATENREPFVTAENRFARERVERTRGQVDTGELVADVYGDDDVGENQDWKMEPNFQIIVGKMKKIGERMDLG